MIKFTLHTKFVATFPHNNLIRGKSKEKRSVTPTKISQQILIGGYYGFNLNSLLKLLSYPLITANNNLSLIIYCENIVKMLSR